MTATPVTRRGLLRPWGLWTAGFLAFPLAGLAGLAVAGPIDDLLAALIGGAITGLVLGVGQSLAGRGAFPASRWVPATALGMAVGLALGSAAVGYRTTLADLALMGVLTGIPLGLAQALALPSSRVRWLWAVTTPALWGLGWTVTTVGGIAVDQQFAIFGAYGAVTVSALSGLVLHGWIVRRSGCTGCRRSARPETDDGTNSVSDDPAPVTPGRTQATG
jgi:hypothetical protein